MALDSVGNPRIDFAWGNFPMQPDDKRGLPLGGSYNVVALDDYSDANNGRITFDAAPSSVTVGSIIKLTGLVNGVDQYGNPLYLSNLNRNYLVTKVETPMPGYGSGPTGGVIAHVDAAFQQIAEGYVYLSTKNNPPSPQLVGVKAIVDGAGVIGGGAGDYGWSQTTPVNSAITTAANNPFENIQGGWNGYPGYIGGDIDDVPGGIAIPNVVGQTVSAAGENLADAGFTPGTVTNDKSGWTLASNFGTRYVQFGNLGNGKTQVQFYAGETLTTSLSGGSVLTFNFTAANMGNYSYMLDSYPAAFAFLNSRQWTLNDAVSASGGWFYATADGVFDGPTPNTWTDNYDVNGKNSGIGSITTTENTNTVKRTVPAAGKTATAGSYVDIVKYGPVAAGQINSFTNFSMAPTIQNRLAIVVKPEDISALMLMAVGQFVTVTGITKMYLNWYDMAINKQVSDYVNLAQVNKSHEIEFIDLAGGVIVLKTTLAEIANVPAETGFNINAGIGQTTLWSLDA